jgi:hypothetical protein
MTRQAIIVDIGDMPVRLSIEDSGLLTMLQDRYAGFVSRTAEPVFDFEVSVVAGTFPGDADLSVRCEGGRWLVDRGDFHAEWDSRTRTGAIRQTRNPYAADSVLRIVHTLLLSVEGGFLLHAASAVRGGRAYVFAGPSGAGKTTVARLAPADVTLLSDEISYIRKTESGYAAFGTPFAGEMGQPGEKISAPLAAIYRLDQASANRAEPLEPTRAVSTLLRNLLFFSDSRELTRHVFDSACNCAGEVPMYSLAFTRDANVWNLIS